jgi:hypothetical protein
MQVVYLTPETWAAVQRFVARLQVAVEYDGPRLLVVGWEKAPGVLHYGADGQPVRLPDDWPGERE